ncbi:cytochrome c [Aquisalimonas sp.]|uniref:c-type cytochrome n=1 Tax=Aquisalimonas sp. TaxID=1872621 RepID=UPI0025C2EB82|nr:cytochrome c [Aquisalimonas sp.]
MERNASCFAILLALNFVVSVVALLALVWSIACESMACRARARLRGDHYDHVMPAFGDELSSAGVAAVTTYVRSQWGNDTGEVDAELVERHPDRSRFLAPYTRYTAAVREGLP